MAVGRRGEEDAWRRLADYSRHGSVLSGPAARWRHACAAADFIPLRFAFVIIPTRRLTSGVVPSIEKLQERFDGEYGAAPFVIYYYYCGGQCILDKYMPTVL